MTVEVPKPGINPKVRVQLDLSQKEIERMNWMMNVCDLQTRKDLFNNALTLLEWAAKEVTHGKRIASFDDDTKERFWLTMPALQAALAHGQKYHDHEEDHKNTGLKVTTEASTGEESAGTGVLGSQGNGYSTAPA